MNKTHARRSIHNNILSVSNFVFAFLFTSNRGLCAKVAARGVLPPSPPVLCPLSCPAGSPGLKAETYCVGRPLFLLRAARSFLSKRCQGSQVVRAGGQTSRQTWAGRQKGRRQKTTQRGRKQWLEWELGAIEIHLPRFPALALGNLRFPAACSSSLAKQQELPCLHSQTQKKKETERDKQTGRQTGRATTTD